jgi:tight adherence protein B
VTVVWGAALAAGILLVLSPWVWPARGADAVAEAPERTGALERLAAAAGLPRLTSAALVGSCALAGGLAAAVAWLVTGLPVLALLGGIVGAAAPIGYLRGRRASRTRQRRTLWPDVCDLVIASVRAGMSLPDAVASLAVSAPEALRPAFAGFARDLAASGHFDSSARRLKDQLADPVGDRIVETLRMARQVGGTELVPVLRALSASVRADAALRAEVESRQSWIRGAALLGVVAPWIILGLLVLRPEGAKAYATPEGVGLIIAGALTSFVAYRLMLRIGRLPEPRRWFG